MSSKAAARPTASTWRTGGGPIGPPIALDFRDEEAPPTDSDEGSDDQSNLASAAAPSPPSTTVTSPLLIPLARGCIARWSSVLNRTDTRGLLLVLTRVACTRCFSVQLDRRALLALVQETNETRLAKRRQLSPLAAPEDGPEEEEQDWHLLMDEMQLAVFILQLSGLSKVDRTSKVIDIQVHGQLQAAASGSDVPVGDLESVLASGDASLEVRPGATITIKIESEETGKYRPSPPIRHLATVVVHLVSAAPPRLVPAVGPSFSSSSEAQSTNVTETLQPAPPLAQLVPESSFHLLHIRPTDLHPVQLRSPDLLPIVRRRATWDGRLEKFGSPTVTSLHALACAQVYLESDLSIDRWYVALEDVHYFRVNFPRETIGERFRIDPAAEVECSQPTVHVAGHTLTQRLFFMRCAELRKEVRERESSSSSEFDQRSSRHMTRVRVRGRLDGARLRCQSRTRPTYRIVDQHGQLDHDRWNKFSYYQRLEGAREELYLLAASFVGSSDATSTLMDAYRFALAWLVRSEYDPALREFVLDEYPTLKQPPVSATGDWSTYWRVVAAGVMAESSAASAAPSSVPLVQPVLPRDYWSACLVSLTTVSVSAPLVEDASVVQLSMIASFLPMSEALALGHLNRLSRDTLATAHARQALAHLLAVREYGIESCTVSDLRRLVAAKRQSFVSGPRVSAPSSIMSETNPAIGGPTLTLLDDWSTYLQQRTWFRVHCRDGPRRGLTAPFGRLSPPLVQAQRYELEQLVAASFHSPTSVEGTFPAKMSMGVRPSGRSSCLIFPLPGLTSALPDLLPMELCGETRVSESDACDDAPVATSAPTDPVEQRPFPYSDAITLDGAPLLHVALRHTTLNQVERGDAGSRVVTTHTLTPAILEKMGVRVLAEEHVVQLLLLLMPLDHTTKRMLSRSDPRDQLPRQLRSAFAFTPCMERWMAERTDLAVRLALIRQKLLVNQESAFHSADTVLEVLNSPLHHLDHAAVDSHFDQLASALRTLAIDKLVVRVSDLSTAQLVRLLTLAASSGAPQLRHLTLMLPLPALCPGCPSSAEVVAAGVEGRFAKWAALESTRTRYMPRSYQLSLATACTNLENFEAERSQRERERDLAHAAASQLSGVEGEAALDDTAEHRSLERLRRRVRNARANMLEMHLAHLRLVADIDALRRSPLKPLVRAPPSPLFGVGEEARSLEASMPTAPFAMGPVAAVPSSSTSLQSTVQPPVPTLGSSSEPIGTSAASSPSAGDIPFGRMRGPLMSNRTEAALPDHQPSPPSVPSSASSSRLPIFLVEAQPEITPSTASSALPHPSQLLTGAPIDLELKVASTDSEPTPLQVAFESFARTVRDERQRRGPERADDTCTASNAGTAEASSLLVEPPRSLQQAFEMLVAIDSTMRVEFVHSYATAWSDVRGRGTRPTDLPVEFVPNRSIEQLVPTPAGYDQLEAERLERERLSSIRLQPTELAVPRMAALGDSLLSCGASVFTNLIAMDSVPVAQLHRDDPALVELSAPVVGWSAIEIRVICALLRTNTCVRVWDWRQLLPPVSVTFDQFHIVQPRVLRRTATRIQPSLPNVSRAARRAMKEFARLAPATLLDLTLPFEHAGRARGDTDDEYSPDDEDEDEEEFEVRLRIDALADADLGTLAQLASVSVPAPHLCMFVGESLSSSVARTVRSWGAPNDPIHRLSCPTWVVSLVADTLAANTGLSSVFLDGLLADEQIQQLECELMRRQPAVSSCRISVLSATSASLAPSITSGRLVLSESSARRLETLAQQSIRHPAVQAAISALTTGAGANGQTAGGADSSLEAIAVHWSALLAMLPVNTHVDPPTHVRARAPIAHLFTPACIPFSAGPPLPSDSTSAPAPHSTRVVSVGSSIGSIGVVGSEDASSPRHPFVLAMVAQLNGLFRPHIDAALTVDSGTISGTRAQWPREMLDLVLAYL